jgi:hypothetical protein
MDYFWNVQCIIFRPQITEIVGTWEITTMYLFLQMSMTEEFTIYFVKTDKPFFVMSFSRWGLALPLNHDPPDLCFQSSWDHSRF